MSRVPIAAVVVAGGAAIWISNYLDAEADRRAIEIDAERQQRINALPECEEPPTPEEPPTLEEEIAAARERLEKFGYTNITPQQLEWEVSRGRPSPMEQALARTIPEGSKMAPRTV